MRRQLTVMELRAFIGALLFLGIHGVKNHSKAWSMAKVQVLVRLQDLLTCQRFEFIGVFLHVVTPEEEVTLGATQASKLFDTNHSPPSLQNHKRAHFELRVCTLVLFIRYLREYGFIFTKFY